LIFLAHGVQALGKEQPSLCQDILVPPVFWLGVAGSLGGGHGGPDRKYKIFETEAAIADRNHPITSGIRNFHVRDEFYYRLNFIKAEKEVHPLVRVTIDDRPETVAWCWERLDHGRSFGFSGLHYHENWRLTEYRRLIAQGVLWTLKKPIPKDGLPVKVTEDDLKLSASAFRPSRAGSAPE